MEKYPGWSAKIKIRTWLTGMGRLFALRHFSIANSKGDILGTAKSGWLVLDLKSRRPQRIEPVFKHLLHLFDGLPSAEEPEKLPAPVRSKMGKSYTVRYSDIDMHHHVNNTKYIEWILDSYPFEMTRPFRFIPLKSTSLPNPPMETKYRSIPNPLKIFPLPFSTVSFEKVMVVNYAGQR